MKNIRIEFCFPDARGATGINFVIDNPDLSGDYAFDLDYARRLQAEFVEFKTVNGNVIVKLNNINAITVTEDVPTKEG